MKTEIDWSSAPEGYPIWIEDIRPNRAGSDRSCWAREGKGEYEFPDGGFWSFSPKGIQYIAHKKPEWTGEGLPPVGAVCEWAGCTFSPEDPKEPDLRIGDQVTIIAHFKDGEFDLAAFTFNPQIHNPDRGTAWVNQGAHGCFRTIRTPEQIAKQERSRACDKMYGVILDKIPQDRRNNGSDICEALYDAGYRLEAAND